MHRFEVWAPLAKSLSVQINGNAIPMNGPDSQGWWRCKVDDAGPGTDYGYLIDDDPKPYPDPRSQWQPNGVHGLSRDRSQARGTVVSAGRREVQGRSASEREA